MEIFTQLIAAASDWARPHLNQISTIFTTALLVIYGDYINRAVKNRFRQHHFLVRTLAFIALCSLGYGLLTTLITPSATRLLLLLGDRYLAPTIVLAFVVLGFLAERKSIYKTNTYKKYKLSFRQIFPNPKKHLTPAH
tara:strand:+ start:549 stop:962 length:414 start_codon:yes stop_codon:yes gene_type:complete